MNWVRKQKVLKVESFTGLLNKMITHPGDLAEASSYETEQDSREDKAPHS